MKVLGIIGGIGPESTIDYYKQIIATYRSRQPDGSFPRLLINSVDAKILLDAMAANALPDVAARYLPTEIQKLANAGADFALISANTPHVVFDYLRTQSPIPLLSIVEATCRAAKALGLKRLGLFGTRYTMQAGFYPAVFSREEITVVAPEAADQDYIHAKYFGELFKGIFLPDTRQGLLAIVERMKSQLEIQGLILGGTELPLILRDEDSLGIPFLDTTNIHVREAVTKILE